MAAPPDSHCHVPEGPGREIPRRAGGRAGPPRVARAGVLARWGKAFQERRTGKRLRAVLDEWQGRLARAWARARDRRRRAASLGAQGERVARRCLVRKGYRILARGYRDTGGEIDLICVDRGCVVFVEVKTRRDAHSRPEDAVNRAKRQRISRAALTYLTRHELLEYPHRYDIVAITWPDPSRPPTVEHWPDAFTGLPPPNLFC